MEVNKLITIKKKNLTEDLSATTDYKNTNVQSNQDKFFLADLPHELT